VESLIGEFFNTLNEFLFEQRDGKSVGNYGQQERILASTRTQPAWLSVEVAWEDTQAIIRSLMKSTEQIALILIEISKSDFEDLEELEDNYNNLTNLYRRLEEVYENVEALVFDPQPDRIYWAEVRSNQRGLTLQAAPLHIGPLMQEYIWHQKESVILTSATLTTAGEFDYIRSRLYAEDAYEVALGSPFDYENSTLLYIPDNIPEPSDRYGHQRVIEQSIIQICKVTGGRILVLFTSYAQLKQTSRAIGSTLSDFGIMIFEQGEGASPHALLESFKAADQAVLLGTRSFWEGVDVPGETLSVLVIVKLPFDVPSDPIIAARSETFDDPFHQYALPEAILRFRQGFGRLIRSETDRGVVVILDKRVLTKRYGSFFITSLPECTKRVGLIQNLPREISSWLNL
jgi:DNA polymerase-3 subunit epsilon/ATP-dependent DNA helicase DinG